MTAGIGLAVAMLPGAATAAPAFLCNDGSNTCVNHGFVFQTPGQGVASPSGRTVLQLSKFPMGYNGLQLFHWSDPEWTSNNNDGQYAVWQHDGNLVVYAAGGAAMWATNTKGACSAVYDGCQLAIQNDGNVVIYNQNSRPVWASNTAF
ncbi:hypothetical protein [Fodinicola feengrottensis]|uniref:hypothetical protein n=1 Tax=Fodinicola feengrottensis TaxID=435914 RepID=UPI0024425C31|nr:hypothetical protein [Fodinicola feengrottensis]